MAQIQAYVFFNGNCREAMTFYKQCLGGELTIQTVGESPMAEHMPAAMHNNVLHAQLVTDGFVLHGSDMMGEEQAVQSGPVKALLECKSAEEVRTLYTKLSSDGQGGHALQETYWGVFGDVTDKFGIGWMFNFTK